MQFIPLVLLIFISNAYAIECEWWQTKVRGHKVPSHERNGSQVSPHPRKEHCRERWKGSDFHIKNFINSPISRWPHQEKFKEWTRQEIKIVLEVLSNLPAWTESKNYSLYRAGESIHKGNSATSEIRNKAIVLYDSFFKEKQKASILVHESAHHLFQKVSVDEMNEFATLSGWTIYVTEDRKVFEAPPKKLIKPDSALNKEEDFSNLLEVFYLDPQKYRKQYPQIYEFFQKRWPL
ncbi:MAG: hypothetical protein ACLGHN_13975 [Bacteriovoracia bacterium]